MIIMVIHPCFFCTIYHTSDISSPSLNTLRCNMLWFYGWHGHTPYPLWTPAVTYYVYYGWQCQITVPYFWCTLSSHSMPHVTYYLLRIPHHHSARTHSALPVTCYILRILWFDGWRWHQNPHTFTLGTFKYGEIWFLFWFILTVVDVSI